MLTEHDIEFIKNTRSDIIANRTEPITLIHEVDGGSDPYTGEPISGVPTLEEVDVIWKEYSTVTNGDRSVIGGIELMQNDIKVTIPAFVTLGDVDIIVHGGTPYSLLAIDAKGLGGTNRFECVARQVT